MTIARAVTWTRFVANCRNSCHTVTLSCSRGFIARLRASLVAGLT
jgi:hypothetical protein